MMTSAKNLEEMGKKNQLCDTDRIRDERNLVLSKKMESHKTGPLFDKMNESLKAMGLHEELYGRSDPRRYGTRAPHTRRARRRLNAANTSIYTGH